MMKDLAERITGRIRTRKYLLALLLVGCSKQDPEPAVLMLDDHYRAEILLDNDDGITSPDGLLWSAGQLYIADEGGSAVRVWAPGQGVRTLADATDGLSSPEDLALGSDLTIYVSDDDVGGVWRIASSGEVVRLAPQVTSSEGLAMTTAGLLLVGDPAHRQVLAFGADGALASFDLSPINKAESLAFDSQGDLYIADNRDQVLYFRTFSGTLSRTIHDRIDFSPESLHYSTGVLFITDSNHGKVYRYTPEDGLVTIAVFRGSLAGVQGITSDERGNLFVSVQSDLKHGRGCIVRLTRR